MDKQIILSLDSATKTGWAIYKNGKIEKHATKRFNASTRVAEYGKWLEKLITRNKINTIVAEDIFREHSRTKDRAFQTLAQLQGVLMYLSDKHVIELKFIEPLRVKNHMIPSIRPHSRTEDKSRMINRVKKLGYELETDKSDDEADAIGIMITYLDDKSLPITHPNQKTQ